MELKPGHKSSRERPFKSRPPWRNSFHYRGLLQGVPTLEDSPEHWEELDRVLEAWRPDEMRLDGRAGMVAHLTHYAHRSAAMLVGRAAVRCATVRVRVPPEFRGPTGPQGRGNSRRLETGRERAALDGRGAARSHRRRYLPQHLAGPRPESVGCWKTDPELCHPGPRPAAAAAVGLERSGAAY